MGGFGLDGVMKLDRMTRPELEESLGLSLGERALMVTFHPETASGASPRAQMAELLAALEETAAQLVFTMPNVDNEGRVLFGMIEDFLARHPERACVHTSLGQRRYLSALAEVGAMVSNSSSGLLEVPAFGKGTVNIGARQDGRLRAASVVDCAAERRPSRRCCRRPSARRSRGRRTPMATVEPAPARSQPSRTGSGLARHSDRNVSTTCPQRRASFDRYR